MWRILSHVTYGDKNIDGGILTQRYGLQRDMFCGSHIQRQGSARRRGVWCCETGPTGGVSILHASTGRTW